MHPSRPLLLSLFALAFLALIPVVFWAGAGYAVEEQVWDAATSTYSYVERPLAEVVMVATLALCAAFAAAAGLFSVRAVAAREGRSHALPTHA
ncbi:hypothetical protein ACFXQA_00840 [Microbacterium sp. P07]|uniref:hypothetical protein n=1 Tax=Microbacterium sp. P07 TaxID=3366952 RepID=UPI0037454159